MLKWRKTPYKRTNKSFLSADWNYNHFNQIFLENRLLEWGYVVAQAGVKI